MSEAKVRVLIVEDRRDTREALEACFRLGGLEIAGAYATGEEALARLGADDPDVALVDLGLPGLSGVETIRRLRAQLPLLPVLVLTVFETPQVVVEAIEAGASGYLLKDTPLAQVRAALDQVLRGLAPISAEVARHLLQRVRERAPALTDGQPLTPREQEVLELLVRGHTYASIAEALGIHLGTVQGHVRSVYRKLEVASKTEAACVALRQGLVRLEG